MSRFIWMPTSRGLFTLIDADNQHLFEGRKWFCVMSGRKGQQKPYVHGHIGRFDGRNQSVPLHRAITGCPPGKVVDHINGDTLDNRRENLRICSRQQNNMNVRKAGLKGVSLCRPRTPNANPRWRAYIRLTTDGSKAFIHLGMFSNPLDAALAYNLAAVQYFGRFASLNDISSFSRLSVSAVANP